MLQLVLELMTRHCLYVHAVIQLGFLCLGHLIMFYFRSKIIENCKTKFKKVLEIYTNIFDNIYSFDMYLLLYISSICYVIDYK